MAKRKRRKQRSTAPRHLLPATVERPAAPSYTPACSVSLSIHLVLLIGPVLVLCAVATIIAFRGPFYLGANLDPEYHYLVNATRLADFEWPTIHQHPGIPVAVLTAAVITGGWFYRGLVHGWAPKIYSVIEYHHEYLMITAYIVLLLIVGMIFLVGRRIYQLTGSILPALAVQAVPLLSFIGLARMHRVAPESIQLLVALGLIYVLSPMTLGADPTVRSREPKRAVWAGLWMALGIAAKYYTVSFCVLVLLFPGIRQKVRVMLACAAGVVVMMTPVLVKLPTFQGYTNSMIGESGGGAEVGGSAYLSTILSDASQAFWREPLVSHTFLFTLAVVFVLTVVCWRNSDEQVKAALRALWVGCATIVATMAILSLRYRAHYLIPAIAITWLIVPNLVRLLQTAPVPRKVSLSLGAVALVLVALMAHQTWREAVNYGVGLNRFRANATTIAEKLQERPECAVTGLYRSSYPLYALEFGNGLSENRYGAALEEVFPGQVWYNPWRMSFLSWTGEHRNLETRSLVQNGRCVLLQGTQSSVHNLIGWQLQPVLVPARRHFDEEGLWQLSLDANHPALISTPQPFRRATVVEAESFRDGNVSIQPSGPLQVVASEGPAHAEYAFELANDQPQVIRIRYASEEARPVRVILNGETILEAACPIPTGGFEPRHQRWHDLGGHPVQAGENVLRIESDGPFPHIDRIAYGVQPQ